MGLMPKSIIKKSNGTYMENLCNELYAFLGKRNSQFTLMLRRALSEYLPLCLVKSALFRQSFPRIFAYLPILTQQIPTANAGLARRHPPSGVATTLQYSLCTSVLMQRP